MTPDSSDENSFAAGLIDVIQHSKLFAELDRASCEALLPKLEKLSLKQGEILFNQGDSSDCLYILVEGQLIATLLTPEGKQKIIGTVERGETVGELGALSSQPRSLTIKAAVDSHILKFPREEFEKFGRDQPKFISRVVELVINRSQNTLKLISQKRLYQHIAIVRGDDRVGFDKFIEKLKENFHEDAHYVFIDNIRDYSLLKIIDDEEHAHVSVIFILNQENFNDLQIKINHIGGIYVIVDGDYQGKLNDFALRILNRQQTPFTTQYELVLMHRDYIKNPTNTLSWLQQADFTLHHHIRYSDNIAYQRLLRFMEGKAVGVVLGGGGGKGWVSLGVIQALMEANIPIDAVGGTSVGSAVAACYATFLTYEKIRDAYLRLVHSNKKMFSLYNLSWPLISLTSAKRNTEMLKEVFQDAKIEDLWVPYFSIAVNLSTGKEVVHHQGLVWERIRASAAIPGVVPPMVLDGELYLDGGLLNNLPVDHMRALLGDDACIVAVSLTGTSEKIPRYSFPPIIPFHVGLLRKLRLGYKDYVFPQFVNTFLQSLLVGASAKETANQMKADILICPDLNKFRVLDINEKKQLILTEIGYQAMREQLKHSKLFANLRKLQK